MNQVLTGVLLKGLEVVSKLNKSRGKQNDDTVTICVENAMMHITSVYTDDKQVKITIPVDNSQNVSATITNVEKIVKALKKFDTYTSIEMGENKATVTDGKKRIQLLTLPDIYATHTVVVGDMFEVDGTKLNNAYAKVKKSISKEIARPILTGVHFKNNYIETVDGYRISQVRITESDFVSDFVIDPKALELILPVAKKDKLDVSITTSQNSYILSAGNNDYTINIVGDLMQGEFLDTSKVFSGDYEHMVSFSENKSILSELEFINDMVGVQENGKPNPVKYILNNDKLTIADTSENTSTEVQFEEFTGARIKDVFKIAFNPIYMLDAIKNISGVFTMRFISELTPMIISNEEEKYLVLPIKLNK